MNPGRPIFRMKPYPLSEGAQLLRAYRAQHGLTQRRAADRLGMSYRILRSIETGIISLPIRIKKAMGISVSPTEEARALVKQRRSRGLFGFYG